MHGTRPLQGCVPRFPRAREHPELSDLASELGGTLNNMALIDRDAGHFAEARKKLLQAIEWQRKALAVNPEDPGYRRYLKTHLKNLIEVCKSVDDTDGVADAERQLAEFRASNPKFEALDDRLSAIAGGEAARDNAERLELAQRAYDTKRFVLAARLFADALTSDYSLAGDRQKQVRYDAACCAALAASAAGDDEDSQLDDAAGASLVC